MGYKTELHCHTGTVSACGRLAPERIVERYLEAGYTTLVITDHLSRATFDASNYMGHEDWDSKIDFFMSSYQQLLQVAKGDLNILLGCEVRINEHRAADFLVYGPDEAFLRGHTELISYHFKQFSDAVRSAGLLLVQAHPFRNEMVVTNPALLDGVEVYNGSVSRPAFRNEIAGKWAEYYDLIPTSGSDLHREEQPISGGIETDEPITSNEQLIAVLKSRDYRILRNDALLTMDDRLKK